MDFMLYAMAIGQLRAYFGFDDSTAGLAGTVTLATASIGGVIFGFVADRFGRTRAMMATILIFSFASLGAATSTTFLQLLFWRGAARARHGRRMGDGRGARERDVSARASQQGDQHHAVRLGAGLHSRGRARRQRCWALPRSGRRPGAGCSCSASSPLSSRSGSGGASVSPRRGPGRGRSRSRDRTRSA